jgi:pimeloyl-ACP methyl ester carboxylesterase
VPRIIERGSGRPIVVVPGVQGRYEWGLPTVEALAALGRVITFSLADEPSSGFAWTESAGFENYVTQLEAVIGVTCATPPVLVGVSYGGLVAAEYAARHPGRVSSLVIASAPPPSWRLPDRALRYLKAPRLMAPVFWLGAPLRAYPEVKAALPASRERWQFVLDQGLRVARAPASTARMARRLRWLASAHFALDHVIDVPCLIVTGDPELERVVPPADTLRYRTWLPAARVVTMSRTGHAGTLTKAREFADAVAGLLADAPAVVPAAISHSSQPETVRAH